MNVFDRGFFIERITVTGNGRVPAELEFRDGLNVVEGSSDTGKSYVAGLIDFAFGASKPPRRIQAAEGYDRVFVVLQERKTKRRHQIERSLGGGQAVIVRALRADGSVESERVFAAKHDADNDQNLSTFLLGLAGFAPAKIRKNAKGETQSLSFRNVAHLAVVNETRIIAEWPPQHPGNKQSATAESEVFRLVITGHASPDPIPLPKKLSSSAAKAQVELLTQMEEQARNDLAQLGVQPEVARAEVERIDAAHASLLGEYENARVELSARESERAGMVRELRNVTSRVTVSEGLIARFELLDRHYETDISRLQAIEETGSMLEQMPAKSCPVCGAAPNAHRSAEADEHFGVESVRTAASKEIDKTERLRADLQNAIADLRRELEEKTSARSRINGELEAIQARIDAEAAPRARTSAEKLKAQSDRQKAIVLARSLVEQLEDLGKRRATAEVIVKKKRAKTSDDESTAATTSEMDGFAQEVEQVLAAWKYPELGRVVFSEAQDDIVITGQDRASHGKGVRAITCAAFITGILRHCVHKGLAHPGLLVLDSPLTAYKDPDPPAGSEGARLRNAGVKEAFYRALAGEFCPGQFIILENQEPPSDVVQRIVYHHFSKSEVGRYGFFPRGAVER
jgi:hypothetical protein